MKPQKHASGVGLKPEGDIVATSINNYICGISGGLKLTHGVGNGMITDVMSVKSTGKTHLKNNSTFTT